MLEHSQMNQYPGVDLDVYVKRFNEKALDGYDPVAKDVLVDIFLHKMIEDYQIYPETCLSLLYQD